MNQYVGLDVSLEETKIHVLDEAGGRVWRGKCASHPDELETTICKHAPGAVRIGLETGPLTTWLWTELSKRRLPMVCLDARQAQRALDMRANKTDANDADGLAHLVRAGWYKEVRVKSRDAMLSKAVSAARRQLLDISTNLSNQVRGLMKTFGLVVPKGKGRIFEANVRRLLDEEHALAAVVLPLLEAWCAIRNRAAELDRLLLRKVRDDANCRRLMTAPASAPSSLPPMSRPSSRLPTSSTRATWVPGLGSRPGGSSRAKWTTMAISRGGETNGCARCFTRPQP